MVEGCGIVLFSRAAVHSCSEAASSVEETILYEKTVRGSTW